MVKNLIKVEDSYINTQHPDFMGGAAAMVNVFDPSNYTDKKAHQEVKNEAFDFAAIKNQINAERESIKAQISKGIL